MQQITLVLFSYRKLFTWPRMLSYKRTLLVLTQLSILLVNSLTSDLNCPLDLNMYGPMQVVACTTMNPLKEVTLAHIFVYEKHELVRSSRSRH